MKRRAAPRTALMTLLLAAGPFGAASAHVPYVEEDDYNTERPFDVEDVEHSKAIYASIGTAGDFDVYRIELKEPARIYVTVNTPYCEQYADFGVTFALIGPDLPPPTSALPLPLPPGHGARIVRDPVNEGQTRTVWKEPFSGQRLWLGQELAVDKAPPGLYQVVYWHEQGRTGDYVAVIGEAEVFGIKDMGRVAASTTRIAGGKNLMVPCNPAAD